MHELKLTENTATSSKESAEKGDAYVDRATSRFICPITGLEMSGRYRFALSYSDVCHYAYSMEPWE